MAGCRSGAFGRGNPAPIYGESPDRVAAERARYHLGWKFALDLELSDGGFHPTVLVYFRDRLEENKAERVIF
jgi:hypothetical protein